MFIASKAKAKADLNVIDKVLRLGNKLLLFTAEQPDIPQHVIMLDRLKTIGIYNFRPENSYTLRFEFVGSDDAEVINMPYKNYGHEWEADTNGRRTQRMFFVMLCNWHNSAVAYF